MGPRWGTPVASYVARPQPDARPLDRGKPRDEHTEGGNQPANKSLINRRLPPHPQPCAASIACPAFAPAKQSHSHVFILDREHKRLARSQSSASWSEDLSGFSVSR